MHHSLLDAGKLLATSQSIIITTHVQPDGDGLGAEIALYHYLARLKKNVFILNPDRSPERYRFLDPSKVIKIFHQERSLPFKASSFDLAVIVDTHDTKHIGPLWDYFATHAKNILILDHHPEIDWAKKQKKQFPKNMHTVVDVKSSSIGELLYRLFHESHRTLDPKNSRFELSPEIALGLYVSIITDTNSFRYARTTALSHQITADLITYGIKPEDIYQNIYSSKLIDHLRLIGHVLAKVQQTSDGKIAWVEISRALRKKYRASGDDTQVIVNFLLLLKKAEILILFREEDNGHIKVSLKSKGSRTVNQIAQEFGGGGHMYASGFVIKGKMSHIRNKLIQRLKK